MPNTQKPADLEERWTRYLEWVGGEGMPRDRFDELADSMPGVHHPATIQRIWLTRPFPASSTLNEGTPT